MKITVWPYFVIAAIELAVALWVLVTYGTDGVFGAVICIACAIYAIGSAMHWIGEKHRYSYVPRWSDEEI